MAQKELRECNCKNCLARRGYSVPAEPEDEYEGWTKFKITTRNDGVIEGYIVEADTEGIYFGEPDGDNDYYPLEQILSMYQLPKDLM